MLRMKVERAVITEQREVPLPVRKHVDGPDMLKQPVTTCPNTTWSRERFTDTASVVPNEPDRRLRLGNHAFATHDARA